MHRNKIDIPIFIQLKLKVFKGIGCNSLILIMLVCEAFLHGRFTILFFLFFILNLIYKVGIFYFQFLFNKKEIFITGTTL